MSDTPQAAPTSSPTDLAVLQLLSKMTSTLERMETRLSAVEGGAQPQVLQQYGAPAYRQPAPVANPWQPAMPSMLPPAPRYWVRLKPMDKQRGHLRRGQFIPQLGMVLKGGTGAPGDVPVWAAVENPQHAYEISQLLQNDMKPHTSAFLCDVVTDEQRAQIDRIEEAYRMSSAGMSGMPVGLHQNAIGVIRAREAVNTPSVVSAAQNFAQPTTPPSFAAPQVTPTHIQQDQMQQMAQSPEYQEQVQAGIAHIERYNPADLGGRAAALQGLQTVPPPPAAAPPPQVQAAPVQKQAPVSAVRPRSAAPAAPQAAPQVQFMPPPPPLPPIGDERPEDMDMNFLRLSQEDTDAIRAAAASEQAVDRDAQG